MANETPFSILSVLRDDTIVYDVRYNVTLRDYTIDDHLATFATFAEAEEFIYALRG